MNRQVLVAGVAVAALACGLSACGGSAKKAAPKPAATTATTPAVPVQPKGANGVTYDIQNWDDYASDPAVLAWKQTYEALGASLNAGKVLPALRAGAVKPALRTYLTAVVQAKKNQWHVKDVGQVKVQSADISGDKASLTMCMWAPTTGLYEKSGKYYGKTEVFWFKQNAQLKLVEDRWVITSSVYDGKCPGGAPA